MIIDSYIHIHPFPTADNGLAMPPGYEASNRARMSRIGIDPDDQATSAVQRMNAAGVDVAVIQNPFPHPDRGHVRSNDSVAEAIAAYPDRLYAFAGFQLAPQPDLAELERAVTQLGMKGTRLLPSTQEFMPNDWELMDPVYDLITQLGIVAFCQTGPTIMRPNIWACDLRPWYDVARRHPKMTFCIAHLGHGSLGGLEMAMSVANASPNGYIDAAGFMWFCAQDHLPPRQAVSASDQFLHGMLFPETTDGRMEPDMQAAWDLTVDDHARLLRHVANGCQHKLIYGTDIPYIGRFDLFDLYRAAIPDRALCDEITGATMQRLLGI